MKRENSTCDKRNSRNLLIRFIGDLSRGKRLQEAVRCCGWKMDIQTYVGLTTDQAAHCRPDLVILDGFPDSELARSVYHQLQHFNKVLFLALNETPNAMKFLHVNALSFIRIINRDPEPNALIQAIVDLVRSNRKLPSRQPGMIDVEGKWVECSLIHRRGVQGNACC